MLTEQQANDVYDILVNTAGAHESMREPFVYEFSKEDHTREWRFGGKLGYGGKFRMNGNGVYVDCYLEDETKETIAIVETTNALLKGMLS